ncbi:hypothetical protein CR513_47402, partial [Mucuna pruriens]
MRAYIGTRHLQFLYLLQFIASKEILALDQETNLGWKNERPKLLKFFLYDGMLRWTLPIGVPPKSGGINNTSNVPQKNIKYDNDKFNLDVNISPMKNTQPKTKRKISHDKNDKE